MSKSKEKKYGGGPAYPVFPDTGGGHAAAFHGMTLRDWFAGQVLPAMATDEQIKYLAQSHVMADEWPTALAKDAYRIADAMIAEREKGQDDEVPHS